MARARGEERVMLVVTVMFHEALRLHHPWYVGIKFGGMISKFSDMHEALLHKKTRYVCLSTEELFMCDIRHKQIVYFLAYMLNIVMYI